MMVNLNCQLYRIESFLGDTLLGMSTRVFLEGPRPPEWVAPFHGLGSWTEKAMGHQLSSGIPSSPFPGCSYDMNDYLKLLPPEPVTF